MLSIQHTNAYINYILGLHFEGEVYQTFKTLEVIRGFQYMDD
ncbi:hypothetical protein HanHA300_Chr08g0273171 [Helianthus annuus]|nr:hypothetical protein HanHA300_Chr08g0273171 [Helianthus annuus]KAJ0552896.1 hypothetical protein HanHA89_Chr08g0290311 [Helianthus annuus]KAJ0718579.1 hypothetical protein HanLR1_Chr08g0272171 [Helianthus annuus]